MIVSGGENVYCSEVEEALYAHSALREAAVLGIPDERWGEAVHTVVVPRADVTEEELTSHCRSRIAGYKTPKRIEIRGDPLPKPAAAKILSVGDWVRRQRKRRSATRLRRSAKQTGSDALPSAMLAIARH